MSIPAFNRILARYLAQSLKAGAACDEALVLHCYTRARREASITPRFAQDALAEEVRLLCVEHDLEVIKRNRARFDRMSLLELEAELFKLLNPDIRAADGKKRSLVF